MTAGSVIGGSGDITLMVCTPPPGTSNVMTFAPGVALAVRIAHRSEPGPSSAAVVTTSELTSRIVPTACACVMVAFTGWLRFTEKVSVPVRMRLPTTGTLICWDVVPGGNVTVPDSGR